MITDKEFAQKELERAVNRAVARMDTCISDHKDAIREIERSKSWMDLKKDKPAAIVNQLEFAIHHATQFRTRSVLQ